MHDRDLQLGDRLLRAVVQKKDVAQDIHPDCRRRVERYCPAGAAQGLVLPADGREQFAVLLVSLPVVRIDFERPEIVGLCLFPLPAVTEHVSERDLRPRDAGIDRERANRCLLGGGERRTPGIPPDILGYRARVVVRGERVSLGKAGPAGRPRRVPGHDDLE